MRLRIDALVYSADAISANWHRLKTGALSIASDVSNVSLLHRADMLSSAWSIVDELNSARMLVADLCKDSDEIGPKTRDFLSACVPVTNFRNKLRHLPTNLHNEAAKKGSKSPLFGALSWLWCPEPHTGKAHVMVLQSGTLHGNESFKVLNPAGKLFAAPVDLFQLSAFDGVLELSKPIHALSVWIESNAQLWWEQLDAKIKAHAEQTGEEESKYWEHGPGGFSAALAVNFGEGGITPSLQSDI